MKNHSSMFAWKNEHENINSFVSHGVAYFNVVYVQCVNKCFNINIFINAGGF